MMMKAVALIAIHAQATFHGIMHFLILSTATRSILRQPFLAVQSLDLFREHQKYVTASILRSTQCFHDYVVFAFCFADLWVSTITMAPPAKWHIVVHIHGSNENSFYLKHYCGCTGHVMVWQQSYGYRLVAAQGVK
jgi:hypothetical protein